MHFDINLKVSDQLIFYFLIYNLILIFISKVSLVTESDRNKILDIIEKHEDINSIISLLSYDFQALEVDLREQRCFGRGHRLNDLKTSINENTIISLDFSRNENFCRHRLIINELLQMQHLNMLISTAQLKETFYKSELFELGIINFLKLNLF